MMFHFSIELLNVFIALTTLSLVWGLTKRHHAHEPKIFWFAAWAGTQLIFNTFHCYFSLGFHGANLASFIPYTYLVGAISDPVLAFFSVFAPNILPKFKGLSRRYIKFGLLFGYVILTSIVILLIIESHPVAYSTGTFGRPKELLQIIPGIIVLTVIWQNNSLFSRVIKYSTLFSFLGGITMLYSRELFDLNFNAAHLLKTLSFSAMLFNALYLLGKVKQR